MGNLKEGVSEGTNGSYPMFYLYHSIVGHFIIIRSSAKFDGRASRANEFGVNSELASRLLNTPNGQFAIMGLQLDSTASPARRLRRDDRRT